MTGFVHSGESFPDRYSDVPRLRQLHRHIAVPEGGHVTAAFVNGDYDFCHYLQDGMDDSGWGCAY
eukprot:9546-Eustigmatos_ZCMA.PRE.1